MRMSELEEERPCRVVIEDKALVLVRVGDEVFALEDRCSHQKVALSGGFVDGSERSIECPRHGSQFSLDDGTPLQLPATRPVRTYPIRVVEDTVEIVMS